MKSPFQGGRGERLQLEAEARSCSEKAGETEEPGGRGRGRRSGLWSEVTALSPGRWRHREGWPLSQALGLSERPCSLLSTRNTILPKS